MKRLKVNPTEAAKAAEVAEAIANPKVEPNNFNDAIIFTIATLKQNNIYFIDGLSNFKGLNLLLTISNID